MTLNKYFYFFIGLLYFVNSVNGVHADDDYLGKKGAYRIETIGYQYKYDSV